MKIETWKDGDTTLIGYLRTGQILEIRKFSDGKTFYRVDHNGRTVSSLHRTKAEAMKSARKYISKNFPH